MRAALSMICMLAAISVAGCAKEAAKEEAPRTVLVRTINLGDSGQLNVYSGEVRARNEADLGFRVGGKVIERTVNLGDSVRRGQVLARLDPQDIMLSATAARAQVAAADADVRLAEVEYDRAKMLAGKEFVSGSVVDQRRTALLAATSRLKQAQAQAAVAINQTGYASLVADRDGVVTAVPVESGQVVAAGQPVVRVAKGEEREVLIYVPERRVAGIKDGAPVLVRPWADQKAMLPGVVREVGAAADSATRTFPVRVSVTGGEALSLGSTAAVAFPSAVGGSVVLPHGAIVQRDGASSVWVVGKDNRLVLRKVQLGSLREEGAVITSGLANGEQVAVVGAHRLSAGMKVRPQPESGAVALDAAR